jgi:hypothetical protein
MNGFGTPQAMITGLKFRRRRLMRTLFWLVVISFFGLGSSNVLAAPVLQVTEPKFDFGEVYQGDKVLHVFQLVNEGNEDLLIDRVKSSCGCTAVLVSEKKLFPGGKGELQANFDSSRFRGEVSKTIYVYSNDPVNPVKQLHIQGKVLELVAVEPAQINLGRVKPGEPVKSNVSLRNQGETPLTIGVPRSTATELKVKISKTAFNPGETVNVELQLTPKPGQSRFSGYILVPVNGVPKNELRIPVYATIADQ